MACFIHRLSIGCPWIIHKHVPITTFAQKGSYIQHRCVDTASVLGLCQVACYLGIWSWYVFQKCWSWIKGCWGELGQTGRVRRSKMGVKRSTNPWNNENRGLSTFGEWNASSASAQSIRKYVWTSGINETIKDIKPQTPSDPKPDSLRLQTSAK